MGVVEDLPGFNVQLEKVTYKNNLDWFIAARDPREVFVAQPTYVLSEYLYYTVGFLTLIHSLIVGKRWKYLWIATLMTGLFMNPLQMYMFKDMFWFSQSSVMLLGRHLPLHTLFAYPTYFYNSAYLVSHMKLPRLSRSIAGGLVCLLIALPCELMSGKFVHWTLHDTDDLLAEKHHTTPWFSHVYMLGIGTSFVYLLNFWRKRITGSDSDDYSSSVFKEMVCVFLTPFTAVMFNILQTIIFYNLLHDSLKIPAVHCFISMASIYMLIVWEADRSPSAGARKHSGESSHWSVGLIVVGLLLHYSLYLGMAIVGSPEQEVSIGFHEKTGPCDWTTEVTTPFGYFYKKRTYLCTKDFNENFDFHCLKALPKNGVEWYTICGTKFDNRPEYIAMILGICSMAIVIFYNLLFRSSVTVGNFKKVTKTKKNK